MKKLILLAGLPRSGKSTYAKGLIDGCGAVIVNPDSIRLAIHGQPFIAEAESFVWAVAYAMTEALFIAGHDVVVVDATNTNEKARKPWYDRFQEKRTNISVELVVIGTSKGECMARAILSNQSYLIPVIERMAAETDLEALK
jgi:predicted kinase